MVEDRCSTNENIELFHKDNFNNSVLKDISKRSSYLQVTTQDVVEA